MRLLYVSWFAAWAEALVSLPTPTRRLLPLRRAEEEQVDPNVREIVSAAMYGTPAEVAATADAHPQLPGAQQPPADSSRAPTPLLNARAREGSPLLHAARQMSWKMVGEIG